MQNLTLSNRGTYAQPLDKPSLRQRAVRFLRDRYAHREQPGVAAEFIVLAIIVAVSTWPLLTLAHVMNIHP